MHKPDEEIDVVSDEHDVTPEAQSADHKKPDALTTAVTWSGIGALAGAAIGGLLWGGAWFLVTVAYGGPFSIVLLASVMGLIGGALVGAPPGALLGLLASLAFHVVRRTREK